MRGIPVSEKYRGIRSDGIIYRALTKYRGIPSDGTDFQYAYEYIIHGTIYFILSSHFLSFYANHCM